MAPASRENSMMGNVVEACTSATFRALSLSVVISHDAPTACTSPPKLDESDASQIARKIGIRRGDGPGPPGGSCSVNSPPRIRRSCTSR